jgi:hypothetical protein
MHKYEELFYKATPKQKNGHTFRMKIDKEAFSKLFKTKLTSFLTLQGSYIILYLCIYAGQDKDMLDRKEIILATRTSPMQEIIRNRGN